MDRLFLDANVLFSAAYRPDAGLARLWRLSGVELLTSAYAVEEARINLSEDAQRQRLGRSLAAVRILPASLSSPLPAGIDLAEKDRPVLLAAIGARATHLLTGDRRHFGKYFGRTLSGVLVQTPADYLRGRSDRKRPAP